MDYLGSFAISAVGMQTERLRLDAASLNVANANVNFNPETMPIKPVRVSQLTGPSFGSMLDQLVDGQLGQFLPQGAAALEEVNTPPRMVYDPKHPQADDKGYLYYPNINMATEMVTLLTAVRGYEANVVAFSAAKSMAQKAIDLGGSR